MSLLFPLYALAALGVAAPVLFHLFQRRPQGQRQFSSLLFLDPTPPKVTSRSRLSDILLLLCRALTLLFLAIAFARPFLRSASLLDVQAPSRSVVVLVDTSASMRRVGIWDDLESRMAEVIDDLRPIDDVALIRFDRQPAVELGFEAWRNLPASSRIGELRQLGKALTPSWQKTDLSQALTLASDLLLEQVANAEDAKLSRPMQVVLLSDLQEGTDLSALQSYQWPAEVKLDLKLVEPSARSNASLHWLPADVEERDNQKIRVLVRNEAGSDSPQLELIWKNANGQQVNNAQPFSTHVPPGQSRVVRLKQPVDAFRLELSGDKQSFDNVQYIPITKPEEQELWFLGDSSDSTETQFFFLKQSPLDTRERTVDIKAIDQLGALATVSPEKVPLVIVETVPGSSAVSDPTRQLRAYAESGGRVLVTLTAAANTEKFEAFLGQLFGADGIQIEHVEPIDEADYAMLSEVEFGNPLLLPFADTRFNDFTKIRFWSHRSVSCSEEAPWQVLARFDDGSPALLEMTVSKGLIWVLTSGWHQKESQLALSTKFVPLLHGFYGDVFQNALTPTRYEIGDSIAIRFQDKGENVTVKLPSGDELNLNGSLSFDETSEPGIYEFRQGSRSYEVAVNLAKEESRTTSLMPGRLEQLGVKLDEQRTVAATETEQRQMRNKELEGRQKFWRWGILAALCLIAGETWLSARRTEASRPSNRASLKGG